jgi:hypothetical protein
LVFPLLENLFGLIINTLRPHITTVKIYTAQTHKVNYTFAPHKIN